MSRLSRIILALWPCLLLGLPLQAAEPMPAVEQAEFFRVYCAIGDSLSQGCQAFNVEEGRQHFSMPAQLARQLGTEFNQPLMRYPGCGPTNLEDMLKRGEPARLFRGTHGRRRVDRDYANQVSLNNFALTGATLHQSLYWSPAEDASCVIDFIGLTNPWITNTLGGHCERLRASAVTQALGRNPTFLTVWLGNNDTVISGMLGISKYLTPVEAWQRDWDELVRRIKATPSVKGVVLLNLPYIDSAAYLQPVGNAHHTVHGRVTPGSLVPFFARESYGDADVLTPAELARIRARVDSYNAIIRQTSEREGWPLVDVNAVLVNLDEGGLRLRRADGSLGEVALKRDYATGGLFSLDGLHPTSPAYAYVANEVIKAVNGRYGTQVQLIDEVAIWRQDSLCQEPVDPRGRLDFTSLTDAYNLFCSFLTKDPALCGGRPAKPLPPAPH